MQDYAPTPATVNGTNDLVLTKDDISARVQISTRTLEKLIAKGRFPKPDFYVGRSPRWVYPTYAGWLDWEAGR